MHQCGDILLRKLDDGHQSALEEGCHDRCEVWTDFPVLAVDEGERPRNRIECAGVHRTNESTLLLV